MTEVDKNRENRISLKDNIINHCTKMSISYSSWGKSFQRSSKKRYKNSIIAGKLCSNSNVFDWANF